MDQQQATEIQDLLAWWDAREARGADAPDVPIDQIAIAYLVECRAKGAPSTLGQQIIARIIQECATQPHVRPTRC